MCKSHVEIPCANPMHLSPMHLSPMRLSSISHPRDMRASKKTGNVQSDARGDRNKQRTKQWTCERASSRTTPCSIVVCQSARAFHIPPELNREGRQWPGTKASKTSRKGGYGARNTDGGVLWPRRNAARKTSLNCTGLLRKTTLSRLRNFYPHPPNSPNYSTV